MAAQQAGDARPLPPRFIGRTAARGAPAGRIVVVGTAIGFALLTLVPAWANTVSNLGGGGSLRVHDGAGPWEGFFLPWVAISLICLGLAAAIAVLKQGRPRAVPRIPERGAYVALGVAAAAAMAVGLWRGPGGSYVYETGTFIARTGPLAFAGLALAGVPVIVGLLLGPRRLVPALVASGLLLAVGTLLFLYPPPVALPAPVTGPVPDWRTTPEEPYPFTRPVPGLVATRLDGVYDRPPTETYPGGVRPHCTRCQPYPPDSGRSTLTLDRGRFYVDHVQPRYRSSGHFVVNGSHITFFNDPECTTVRGVYSWNVDDGGRLTLTTLFDLCGFGQRARDLTDAVWSPPTIDAG